MGIWQGGRMWASAPTGVTRTRRPGKHTSLPLIPSRRGRRPRRPASTARPAPAERGGRGIRALPGLEDSPRGTRFIGTSTRNRQPSPAGGRRDALAQPDPPWRFFLLDRARPVLFLSRTKREWGAHCRQQPGIPRPIGRPPILLIEKFTQTSAAYSPHGAAASPADPFRR